VLRTYARVAGAVLVLLALSQFFFPELSLLGFRFPAMTLADGFFHLLVGAIFVYVGFLQGDPGVVRGVVGGMAVLLFLGKGAILLFGWLWGVSPLFGPTEVTCLVAGILSLLAAWFLPDGRTGRR